jgi:hypothetical protein
MPLWVTSVTSTFQVSWLKWVLDVFLGVITI